VSEGDALHPTPALPPAAERDATASRRTVRAVKDLLRRALGVDPQSGVTPLPRLAWVGSQTHGYCVPEGLLGPGSTCYAVGAGEDITFDTELAQRFGCRVRVVDPTPEGRDHFRLVQAKVEAGEALWSANGEPFRYRIERERLALLNLVEIGVWDRATLMRFWEPTRDNYPSHSVTMFQESGRYLELPVDRLGAIMAAQGDAAIDLLKLEIEGAEYRVIETLIEDRLDIKAIAVEYDEVWHVKGRSRAHLFRIRASTRRLQDAGYRLVHSTPMYKRTFVREDIFDALASGHVAGLPT